MDKKNIVFSIIGLLGVVLAVSSSFMDLSPSTNTITQTESQYIRGNVCVYKNEWNKITNTYGGQELVGCDHNVVYSAGLNMTRDCLGSGACGAITTIALCNASGPCGTPVAAQSESFTEYTNCGLSAGAGTYAVLTPNGNWSVFRTFTSTCNAVNTTSAKLRNATNSNFSSNTFTVVTLQNNDQITLNWTLTAQ